MKAVVRRGAELVLDAGIADPIPGAGQVLVKTLSCGICGSDLHALHHLDALADVARKAQAPFSICESADVIFGHEFCAEVVDYGPSCSRALRLGTRVVSVPRLMGPDGPQLIGFSNSHPGGYAELMVLQEALLLEVPGDLPSDFAATTEPYAVGLHAVARARMDENCVALVIGCGPVGLAVISALKARGFGPIIAADFSASRRAAAERLGVDVIVDPAKSSPHAEWSSFSVPATMSEKAAWSMAGKAGRAPVIFECVGAPGLIKSIMAEAPPSSRILVVGVCMQSDVIEPSLGIYKELSVEFVFGYTPDEFRQTLIDIADQRIDPKLILSGEVNLSGVADTFDRLKQADDLIKVMIRP